MKKSDLTPEERRARRAARRAARKERRAAEVAAAAQAAAPTKAELKKEKEMLRALRAVVKPTGFIKATTPDKGGYAVFINANRRSALRLPLYGSKMVEYIPMTEGVLSVESCTEMLFNTLWERADYDPKRAATFYAAAAGWRGITEDAKTHLERVLGTPLNNLKPQQSPQPRSTEMKTKRTINDNLSQRPTITADDTPQSEVGTAPTASAPTAPEPEAGGKAKPAAKKTAKPAAKKTAKPAAKKTAKPAAKKTAKPAAAVAAPTGKRALMHAKKIKVIISKNPKREGTNAWKKFEVYKTAKTVGEALEKGAKVGFKMSTINYDLKHKFIQLV